MDPHVVITSKPLSLDATVRKVRCRSAGGICTFVGTVRDRSDSFRVRHMELETARDLARADLKRIANVAMSRFRVERVAMCHRTGRLRVGDVIVVIAVSAAHREDAFGACRFIIDSLKKTTPIWKKEIGVNRERWVESEA